jgi:hypothetical protein
MTEIFVFNNMNTTNIISWIGLGSGVAGIIIAGAVAWFNTLRNAKVVSVFSGIDFEKNNILGSRDIKLTGVIVPYFILKNVGARPAIIEDIRLKFCFGNISFFAYPHARLNEEDIWRKFIGITLPFNEAWKNDMCFKSDAGKYQEITNLAGIVSIELKFINKKRWVSVKTNKSNFSFTPEELRVSKFKGDIPDIENKSFFKNFKTYPK